MLYVPASTQAYGAELLARQMMLVITGYVNSLTCPIGGQTPGHF